MDIKNKEKICFYGGCFSPPTRAHRRIMGELSKRMDKVYVVPTNDYYEKVGLMKFENRCHMLNLIKQNSDCKNLEVLEIEKSESRKFKTYEILDKIYQGYKREQNELFFVLGSDNLQKMIDWEKIEEVLERYQFIIIQRNGESAHNIIKNNRMLLCKQNKFVIYDILEREEKGMSSSEYREKRKTTELLEDYITEYLVNIIHAE